MSYWIMVGAGLLMALAPAPIQAWGLAWFALAPLWFVIAHPQRSLQSVILQSLLWGMAYHGVTLSWLMGLHPLTWMGIPWLTSLVIVSICWILVTLWGALFVVLWGAGLFYSQWILAPLQSQARLYGGLRILIGVALWCGLETLRSLSPLDWTPLAFTQSPGNLAILHLGRISGPMTITAVLVLVNAGWAETYLGLIKPRLRLGSAGLSGMQRSPLGLSLTLGLLLCCHGLGLLLYRLPVGATDATPELKPITLGIIQGNIPTREKLTQRGLETAQQRYLEGYQDLARQKVDLVLTPEAALPIRWTLRHPLAQPIVQQVIDRQIPLVLGTFVSTQPGQITQSLLALASNGTEVGRYNKVKLVLLGEYIPVWLQGVIRRLSPLTGSLTPGSTQQVFQTPLGQAAVGICYDSAFSGLFRSQVAAGGRFLMTASNLDPYSEILMAQVHAHDVMRAIESDRPLARATNTGFSGAINAHGETQWLSQRNVFQVQAVVLKPRHTQTLYVRWGDWLTLLLNSFSMITLAIGGWIRSKS